MMNTELDVNYEKNGAALVALSESISEERIAIFLDSTEGDLAKALNLYIWNTAVSAAFYGPLQALEVVLRNAIHRELSEAFAQDWYDHAELGLDCGCIVRIGQAKQRLRKNGRPDDATRLVSSLSFGFWVALLGPGGYLDRKTGTKANYEMTLWRPALCRVFPHATSLLRRDAYKPLRFARNLRNRIAHHEPIFNRHLERDFEHILEVTSWINPLKSRWIEAHSRIPDLLSTPRDEQGLKF